MKSLAIGVTFLVSILGVISKDLSSTENEAKIEESDMLADGDILDLAFDRKGRPGRLCKQWKMCCKKSKEADKDHGLVITGGDNPDRQASSELISHLGICGSPNIPDLPESISGGKSVWFEDRLMFCGGSNIYVGGEVNSDGWGAIDKCVKVRPGDTEWNSHPHINMNHPRSWFSLNKFSPNNKKVVAAGGLDSDGNVLDSLEQYSKGRWRMMDHIKLDEPTYGHCGVHYRSGGDSYLMIIGGSNTYDEWWDPTDTVTLINLSTGMKVDVEPGPLPALWAPACTLHGQDIYVTGGAIKNGGDGEATAGVYKYNLKTGEFTKTLGDLNVPRWGATMGVTAKEQLVVAGGWNGDHLTSVEVSEDGGDTWKEWSTVLSQGTEYAAMASVPIKHLKCQ